MKIDKVELANFRALETVSVSMQQFSVLLGENDVGKTSFLYALDKFFIGKKLSDEKDWFRKRKDAPIRITITFSGIPESEDTRAIMRSDKTIVISKIFAFDTAPETKAILEDQSFITVGRVVLAKWFSPDNFHFIPVRRDLAVQFSMAKTALLGKLLRVGMKQAIASLEPNESVTKLKEVLQGAIDGPRIAMETLLREQLNNSAIALGFDDLDIDPTEGVTFNVKLSDDRVQGIDISDRGAGTQNNLIIALFRHIANSSLQGQFIFAMEEPENSLHPKAQRQLLGVIQEISSVNQVIVTTHSPVFIDRSKYESNILLTRTASGNTIAKVFEPTDIQEVRVDLGIRASDALLKGGGNCAVLVEGSTEEDGFPIFLQKLGFSEFELGIAIIKMGGSDYPKVRGICSLLKSYDIPCVVVLDKDAQQTSDDLLRQPLDLPNLKKVFVLSKGTIEDYYPTAVVAKIINEHLAPTTPITAEELETEKSGKDRLKHFGKIMHQHQAGESIEYLKSLIGGHGTKELFAMGQSVPDEISDILKFVAATASGK
jgi:putative ATP-dependent endonuclease of the OLD family